MLVSWLCKGDDCVEVLKYGDYGSFEHLLSLILSEMGFHKHDFGGGSGER